MLTHKESQAFSALKACILPAAKDRGWAVHVFALGGMDNFAFFSTTKRFAWAEARFSSFAEEIRRRGRSIARYAKGPIGDWLAALPKPCGLFAANDIMAELAVSEAVARKIDIPNEIALVACGHRPI